MSTTNRFPEMSRLELAFELEEWAKPFDAMMNPGFKHERAELLREVARRLREEDKAAHAVDLWSSRLQAATEDVQALTEEIELLRKDNEHLREQKLAWYILPTDGS